MKKLLSLSFIFLFTQLCFKAVAQCDSSAFKAGNVYYNKGISDSAITKYTEQINTCPFSYVYILRGICYYRLHEKDNAFKDFHKASEYSKNKLQTLYKVGNTLFLWKQYDDALTFYKEVATLAPKGSASWYKMARCEWLKRLAVLQANHVEDFRTDSVLQSGLKDAIMRNYNKAVYLDSLGNWKRYKSRSEIDAIKDMQSNYAYYTDRAIFEINFNHLAQALKDFETANMIHPTIQDYRTTAYLAKKLGKNEEACSYIQKWATMINPSETITPFQKKDEADKFCKDLNTKN